MRIIILILSIFSILACHELIAQTIIFQSGFETGDPALTSSSTLGTITQPSASIPRTGTKSGRIDEVSKLYDGSIITPLLSFTAGKYYVVEVYARVSISTGSLDIRKSTVANNASIKAATGDDIILDGTSNVSSVSYTRFVGGFTVSADESKYVGFSMIVTGAGSNGALMAIDDIIITEYTSPQPENYCASTNIGTAYYLTNVTFGSINNTTTNSCTNMYCDYSSLSTIVSPGSSYNISVTTINGANPSNVYVWFDWNNDAVFTNDASERYFIGNAPAGGPTTLGPVSITVPSGAYTGTIRMRINNQRFDDTTNPCGPYASNFGETEDYSVVVCAAPSITNQPINQVVCASSGTAQFSVTSSGTGLTYQWQEYISGWLPLSNGGVYSGVTTSTLTITNPPIGMNGYKYRCVVTNSCGTVTTDGLATLTVTNPTTITTHPADDTVCQNSSTSFSVTATLGPYQWQVSTNNGVSWNNIIETGSSPAYSGYNTATLSLTETDNPSGYLYRCIVGCNQLASNYAILTIIPPSDPDPVDQGTCVSPNSFVLTATGAGPGEVYRWFDALTGGTLLKQGIDNNDNTYTTASLSSTQLYFVSILRVVGGCESYPRTPVFAEIYTAPVIDPHPTDETVNEGGSVFFTVSADGGGLSYQWQVSTNGGSTWTNITAAGSSPTYSGWTTSTLTLYGVIAGNDGYKYRCVASRCTYNTNSNPATLTVTTIPVIYTHPTTGIQSTYVGACMENTCTGTYYDDGGAAGVYSNNINQIYRTFCPNTPYSAIRATVTMLDVEYTGLTCNDALYVQNGPGQGSPVMWAGCGTTLPSNVLTGAGAWGGGVFTSTHSSGCLTFRFASGASSAGGPWDGWQINLECVPFPGGPSGTTNTDCNNAVAICSDISASSFTYGPGLTSDACTGCVTTEYFTEWYRIKIATGGILELEIVPNGVSDLDFAFYRANSCGTLGDPIRCSYAARTSPGKTGMRDAPGTLDYSEDVYGDQWVQEVAVLAGETYFLMINEWDKPNPNQYTLNWDLSAGASFDCSILLPVSMLDFYAYRNEENVDLKWITATEINNNYFTVERSDDCIQFVPVGIVKGAGNSDTIRHYSFTDANPLKGRGYYRIRQTDYDGKSETSGIVSVMFEDELHTQIEIFPNPANEYLNIASNRYFVEEPYEIYNTYGKLVRKGFLNGTISRINLDEMTGGVYIFIVKGSEKKKFILIR
jgi:hypothetical protein